MKYLIAWLPARVAYFLGDITSRVLDGYATLAEYLDAVDEHTNDSTINLLYQVYNTLMLLSCDIDDWGNTKLWSEPVSSQTYE